MKKISQKNDTLSREHKALLERAAQVGAALKALQAVPAKQEPKNHVFIVGIEEGKRLTAISAGDERAFGAWLFNGLNGVLSANRDDDQLQRLGCQGRIVDG